MKICECCIEEYNPNNSDSSKPDKYCCRGCEATLSKSIKVVE